MHNARLDHKTIVQQSTLNIQKVLMQHQNAIITTFILDRLPMQDELYVVGSTAYHQVHNFIRPDYPLNQSNDLDFVTSYAGDLVTLLTGSQFPDAEFSHSSFGATRRFPFGRKDGFQVDIWSILRSDYNEIKNNQKLYYKTSSRPRGTDIDLNATPFTPPSHVYDHSTQDGERDPNKYRITTPSIYTVLGDFSFTMFQIAYAIRTQQLIEIGAIDAIRKRIISPSIASRLNLKDLVFGLLTELKTDYMLSSNLKDIFFHCFDGDRTLDKSGIKEYVHYKCNGNQELITYINQRFNNVYTTPDPWEKFRSR